MKHLNHRTASVPTQQRSSLWRRLRQRLGAVVSTSQREDSRPVSNGNSMHAAGSGAAGQSEQPKTAGQIFDQVWEQHLKDTEGEVERAKGPAGPALVLGPQRYPDPSVWGVDNGGIPLTMDEQYGKAVELIYELGLPDELDRSGY